MTESVTPFVSVIIPARNEAQYLHYCLDSVVEFDYPKERIEVLVVDGESSDRTREIVLEYAAKYPFFRLLQNPNRIIPRAMNIGIEAATGEIIVRLDAHATYAPDYVSRSVELLDSTGAANVGSVQTPVGTNYWSGVVATAMASRFGMGIPAYRFTKGSRWAETAWLGTWKKSTLEAVGGFDEQWIVNQDYELNARLRRAGGEILVSSDLKTQYFVRTTPRGLVRQYFRYGIWRVKTIMAYPESVRIRQLVPPALVTAIIASAAVVPNTPWAIAGVGGLYLTADLVASLSKGLRQAPALLFVYALLHLSWGSGFICGLVRFGLLKLFRSKAEQHPQADRHQCD